MGCIAVMRRDSCVDFGAVLIVFVFTSFLTFFFFYSLQNQTAGRKHNKTLCDSVVKLMI